MSPLRRNANPPQLMTPATFQTTVLHPIALWISTIVLILFFQCTFPPQGMCIFLNINLRLTHFIKLLKYDSPFSVLLNSNCHKYISNLNFFVPLRSNATFVQSFSQHVNTTIFRNNSRGQHHIELYSKWRPFPQQLGENYLCVWGKDHEGYVTDESEILNTVKDCYNITQDLFCSSVTSTKHCILGLIAGKNSLCICSITIDMHMIWQHKYPIYIKYKI